MKENLIINKKTSSGFDAFFRNNAPLNEETMSNVIADKNQDKNEVILDESVTFCHPTPQVHNDIDILMEALITALKSYVSCEISMINRARSRTATISKVEIFVIIVIGF